MPARCHQSEELHDKVSAHAGEILHLVDKYMPDLGKKILYFATAGRSQDSDQFVDVFVMRAAEKFVRVEPQMPEHPEGPGIERPYGDVSKLLENRIVLYGQACESPRQRGDRAPGEAENQNGRGSEPPGEQMRQPLCRNLRLASTRTGKDEGPLGRSRLHHFKLPRSGGAAR